eukprot:gene23616-biopygen18147
MRGASLSLIPYASVMREYLGEAAGAAVEAAQELLSPRLVGFDEFEARWIKMVDDISKKILRETDVEFSFLMMAYKAKSDTWMFYRTMKMMRTRVPPDRWSDVRKRIHVVYFQDFVNKNRDIVYIPTLPVVIVILDDVVYSDNGMQVLRKIIRNERRKFASKKSTKTPKIKLNVQEVFSDTKTDVARRLYEADVAVCISINRPDGKITYALSLFEVHKLKSKGATVHRTGVTTVVFSHKVADTVSIPTKAIMMGPTLRHFISQSCVKNAICDGLIPKDAIVQTCKMRDLVRCAPEKFDHNIIIFKDTQKVVRHPSQLTLIPDKVHRRFETMPFFIPMLKPSSSCGIRFGKLIHDIDMDWSVDVEEEAMHNRCTQPTYKKIINKKNVKKTKSQRAWILYVLEKKKQGITHVKLTTSGEKEQFCSNVLNTKVSDKFVCKDLNSASAFNEEIRTAELLVRNVSASGLAKATTFSSIPFKHFNVVGIDIGGKAVLYRDSGFYVFSIRCSMSAASKGISSDANMDKFVRETLENFDVIHRAGIIHGDVKQDNMIYCAKDDHYRLIDWGKSADHADMVARYVDNTRFGFVNNTSSPMAWFCTHAYTSFNLAVRSILGGNPLFKLDKVTDKNLRLDILDRYAQSFDLYDIGLILTAFVCIYDDALSVRMRERALALAFRLVDYGDPSAHLSTARDALRWWVQESTNTTSGRSRRKR